MDALYCGQHDARDRFYCATHREHDHCQVSGRALLSEAEERALMDELLQAQTGDRLHWTAAMAELRRRYVSP